MPFHPPPGKPYFSLPIRDGLEFFPAGVEGGGGGAGGFEFPHFSGELFVVADLELGVVHAGLDGRDLVLGGEDAVFDGIEFGALLLGKFAGFFRSFRLGFQGFVGLGLVF